MTESAFDAWRMQVVVVALFLSELAYSAAWRAGRKRARSTKAEAAAHFGGAVGQVVIIATCWAGGWWSPRLGNELVSSVLAGLVVAVLLTRGWGRLQEARQRAGAPVTKAGDYVASLSSAHARGPVARVLMALRAICTSTTEEVARSVFVFGALGTEFSLAGAVFAVVFNVVLHLYQGRRYIAFHAFFAVLSMMLIGLFGVLAGVVLHVTYNVALIVRERRALTYVKQLRDYERRVKAQASAQAAGP